MQDLQDLPKIKNLKDVEPEHLIGDKIPPGHPLFGIIWINSLRVSGTPCFFGTRVPIKTLFDCLAFGDTMEEFLDGFEGVDREQAEAVLILAGRGLLRFRPYLLELLSTPLRKILYFIEKDGTVIQVTAPRPQK